MKYYMHVNFIEWLDDLGEITRRCADAGYDGIELRAFDRTERLSLEAYLDEAGAAAASQGLELVFGSRNSSHDPDATARASSLQDLKTVIRKSGDFGVRIINVFAQPLQKRGVAYCHFEQHGSALVTDEQLRWTRDFFVEAAECAAEHDIRLYFETHNAIAHDLPVPTRRLIESIGRPNVGVLLDYGNIYLHPNGCTIDEAIDTLRPYLGYVHMKNVLSLSEFGGPAYRGTPLRDGDINNEQLVMALLQAGFRGPWGIENVMRGDKVHLMRDDLEYLRELMARCQSRIESKRKQHATQEYSSEA